MKIDSIKTLCIYVLGWAIESEKSKARKAEKRRILLEKKLGLAIKEKELQLHVLKLKTEREVARIHSEMEKKKESAIGKYNMINNELSIKEVSQDKVHETQMQAIEEHRNAIVDKNQHDIEVQRGQRMIEKLKDYSNNAR